MSYFKVHRQSTLSRPVVKQVLQVQLLVTMSFSLGGLLFAPYIGASVMIGGLISIAGQAFYNFRALRQYGSGDVTAVISATYSAMWGKWLIIIAASLAAAVMLKELNTGVLYASVFFVHTLGALLLPVLVKRVAS